MTRILHLSDLHFGRPAVPAQIEAIEALVQAERFDVVAISGDLSQRARAGEFQRAAVFIRDARRVSQVIVVPGNHDVAWWYAPLGVGNDARKFENYAQYIAPDLEPVLRVPGATFVGLNTSHGVTRRTLTWNLRDISILGAFADMGVSAVLCGHDHQEAVHYIGHTRKGTVISTAGTVSNRSRGGRPSSLNVLTVRPAEIEVTTFVWSGGAFVPGPHRCFER